MNPYIIFGTGSVPCHLLGYGVSDGSPRFDYEIEKPEKLHEETKILSLPRSRCVFFSLSFFGSLGTMAGLGGWG